MSDGKNVFLRLGLGVLCIMYRVSSSYKQGVAPQWLTSSPPNYVRQKIAYHLVPVDQISLTVQKVHRRTCKCTRLFDGSRVFSKPIFLSRLIAITIRREVRIKKNHRLIDEYENRLFYAMTWDDCFLLFSRMVEPIHLSNQLQKQRLNLRHSIHRKTHRTFLCWYCYQISVLHILGNCVKYSGQYFFFNKGCPVNYIIQCKVTNL